MDGRRALLPLVALLLLAPLLAVVLIATLLLLGADPHLVFLPGHALKDALASRGIPVPNAVGVVTTAVCWWAVIVLVWLALRRGLRRG